MGRQSGDPGGADHTPGHPGQDGRDTCHECREGFTKKLRHVPALLRKTLTYDRGNERAEHARLAERLAIRIFFADPYSPWQSTRNCAIIYPSHLELETALLLFKSKLHHEPQPVSLSRACSSNQTPQVSDLLSWLATVSRPWDPL